MKVVVVEPMRRPYVKEIDVVALVEVQEIVGGYIDCIYLPYDNVILICNEYGKNNGLTPNRALMDDDGRIDEIIYGTFFIVRDGEEDIESLTEKQIDKYIDMFWNMEFFFRENGKVKRIVL